MPISIIAAMGKNRELGQANKLLWHLPDDLKRFKALTTGHAVIMGRKTYASIGKPLPNRKNIVITRDAGYSAPGCTVVGSMGDAIEAAGKDDEIFVIGGGEIYKIALPLASKMYLTLVDAAVPADVYFPPFNESEWKVSFMGQHEKDDKHAYRFAWENYERR